MTTQTDSTNSKPFTRDTPDDRDGEPSRRAIEEPALPGRSGGSVMASESTPASEYIRDNFDADDRLAVVVINKRTGAVVQRLAPAEKIAAPDTQKWLHHMNDHNYEVYISMNALKDDARGRTKEDIDSIRHVYLDLDHEGDEVLRRLLDRSDLPQPNYVLTTSPGRYQAIWKVDGFQQAQAEELQRHLAREMGADPAATDSSRILRLPGFNNRKYAEPHLVEARKLADQRYGPQHFPDVREIDRNDGISSRRIDAKAHRKRPSKQRLSQSERDWAYARRALSRGDSKEAVIAAIASYRRFDKPNPQYYAQLTVDKANRSLDRETPHHDFDETSQRR
jgi:hypothetical protein